tara:strand:- start:20054 stop:22666 length:2613 start_codon:yes stop_codon:yes gene_type:complete
MKAFEKVKLKDYKPYPFEIPKIKLDLSIYDDHIKVISSMKIIPKHNNINELNLKGIDIELEEIIINNKNLNENQYDLIDSDLVIKNIPSNIFDMQIVTRLNPYQNTSLEGLYESCGILTTQCEAEGFRRICFHPDRPDVLSLFEVRIEADIQKYPILLSNGNNINRSILIDDSSRHEVFWEDPFPKPCYLFAIVAGNLAVVKDNYISKSGRIISINIYVENGDENYTKHAINSLKKAMKWDEKTYNLEYDLNEYNIVAVRHFNMGAMENKGLNIFNSKLVLADSSIASDVELERIESVIAHEYFHNWTGNRITCRDWFQLSLKEGLTVFRDQSFTSDLHSPVMKRIEDVSFLRSTQFNEDSGPTAHPVKPNEYLAIDNFYTTTIYEKGAELIRMLKILLGEDNFISGIKSYLKKFDGSAATTEDFIYSVLEDAINQGYKLNFEIKQFFLWYYQSGTPTVSIDRDWNANQGKLTLNIKQNTKPSKSQSKKNPLVIPIKLSLILNGVPGKEYLKILDKNQDSFIFENIPIDNPKPIISVFRDFSAPVKYKCDLSIDELISLVDYDNDLFSVWDSYKSLVRIAILSRASKTPNQKLENSLIDSLQRLINKYRSTNSSFLASILSIPSVIEIDSYQDFIDPISLEKAITYIFSFFGKSLENILRDLLNACNQVSDQTWPNGKGERELIESIWSMLILAGNLEIRNEIVDAVRGESMTLSKAALNSLRPIDCIERNHAMAIFYRRWEDKPVILDTWFGLEASNPRTNSLNFIRSLFDHPRFDPLAPNSIRAVLGGFSKNIPAFHASDGSGYLFMAEQIFAVDQRNPITASRISKIFSRWQSYIEPNSKNMFKAIQFLNDKNLSQNTREVVDLMIS